ncbi:maleylpyruvate isomerase family mycothiol-dependent enzyme [Gandjariella thermophila]|nr:maleylpyruvate isomerase family mycothiol-dependent enzyme [Gandjariella thermophila]
MPRGKAAVERAMAGLRAVVDATERLDRVVERMTDAAARGPSRLPGWTRGHVVSHLARNADALVNLLTWARTGVEHPAYTSRADRDEAIEEGSARPARLLHEDLAAASARFAVAVRELPESAWRAEVAIWDSALAAHEVPWLRWREVLVHLVDLDLGVDFGDLPGDELEALIDDAVTGFHGRPEVPSLWLEAEFDDRSRSWELNARSGAVSATVRGPAGDLLAWLTGRADGVALDAPELPAWA